MDNYEKARDAAEQAIFDWYHDEPGWYDTLPAEAIEDLCHRIAEAILRAWQPKKEG